MIKDSKVPIVCICNDRQHPKIRSLANHCFDLRFYKPKPEQIKGAMMSVCFKEGVKIEPLALMEIIMASGQDVRQVTVAHTGSHTVVHTHTHTHTHTHMVYTIIRTLYAHITHTLPPPPCC